MRDNIDEIISYDIVGLGLLAMMILIGALVL